MDFLSDIPDKKLHEGASILSVSNLLSSLIVSINLFSEIFWRKLEARMIMLVASKKQFMLKTIILS